MIDFGISVKLENYADLKQKAGTLLFIAPEVLSGKYDQKCDIWSCGVFLYMILSGEPPFYSEKREKLIKKIKSGNFTFPSDIWSKISRHGKELIKKML